MKREHLFAPNFPLRTIVLYLLPAFTFYRRLDFRNIGLISAS